MTNSDNRLTRQLNRITLRALREKVKIQCEVAKKGLADMQVQLDEETMAGQNNQATISLKVSIKQY